MLTLIHPFNKYALIIDYMPNNVGLGILKLTRNQEISEEIFSYWLEVNTRRYTRCNNNNCLFFSEHAIFPWRFAHVIEDFCLLPFLMIAVEKERNIFQTEPCSLGEPLICDPLFEGRGCCWRNLTQLCKKLAKSLDCEHKERYPVPRCPDWYLCDSFTRDEGHKILLVVIKVLTPVLHIPLWFSEAQEAQMQETDKALSNLVCIYSA